MSYFANKLLQEQELSLELDKLHINPFVWQATLTSFSVNHKQSTLLSVGEFKADIDMLALIQGELVLEKVLLSSARINAELNGNEVSFNGWQPKQKNTDDTENQSSENLGVNALVRSLRLENVEFQLQAEKQHHLQISQLTIDDFSYSNGDISLGFDLQSQLNQRPINFNGDAHYSLNDSKLQLPQFNGHVQLADYRQWLPVELASLTGAVSLELGLLLEHKGDTWQALFNEIHFESNELFVPVHVGNTATQLSLQQLAIELEDTRIELDSQFSLINAESKLNMQLTSFNWQDNDESAQLINFAALDMSSVKLAFAETVDIAFNELNISDGVFSNLQTLPSIKLEDEKKPEPVVEFNQLSVANFKMQGNELAIASVVADLSDITLYSSTKHAIENLYVFGVNENEPSAEPTQSETLEVQERQEEQSQPLAINIGKVVVAGEPNLLFVDFTPSTPVAHQLRINELQLTNISSDEESSAELSVVAELGKRSQINLQGALNALNAAKNTQIKANISAVDLTNYSPYVADAIDYNVKQGLLFANIDMQIIDEQVKGNVGTQIKAIELSELHQAQTTKASAGSIVPLDIALKQLTDDQGNMEVDIPLDGSIHDPSFGIGGFISIITTKAIKEGAKSYLMQTFLPYANVVSIAMMAGDTLFAIKVNPLAYHPEQVELLKEQLSYAKELARVMKEKQDVQLSVCALVVPNAREVTLPLSDEEFIRYQQQGQTRVEHFIDYLIKNEDIAAERLIPCEAKVSTAKEHSNNLNFTIK